MTNLKREININCKLIHPSVLKFIGYSPKDFHNRPFPVIVTEYASNGSLDHIINLERQSLSHRSWDDTKKLINLFGIASAMSYLHGHEVIHRDLKPGNILEDGQLFPKIADFGLSKVVHSSASMSTQSTVGLKGTPIYLAPEIWDRNEYTKAGDVYAFSIIAYEMITLEEPFKDYAIPMLCCAVAVKNERPAFPYPIPDCYRDLITRCWSKEAEKRPTFSEIVDELKNNKEFITENVDESEYFDYINYIESSHSDFDSSQEIELLVKISENSNEEDEEEGEEEEEKKGKVRNQSNLKRKPIKVRKDVVCFKDGFVPSQLSGKMAKLNGPFKIEFQANKFTTVWVYQSTLNLQDVIGNFSSKEVVFADFEISAKPKENKISVFTFYNGEEVIIIKQIGYRANEQLREFLSEHKFICIGVKEVIIQMQKLFGKSVRVDLEDIMETHFKSKSINEAISTIDNDFLYKFPNKQLSNKHWIQNNLSIQAAVYTSFKAFWLSEYYERIHQTNQDTQIEPDIEQETNNNSDQDHETNNDSNKVQETLSNADSDHDANIDSNRIHETLSSSSKDFDPKKEIVCFNEGVLSAVLNDRKVQYSSTLKIEFYLNEYTPVHVYKTSYDMPKYVKILSRSPVIFADFEFFEDTDQRSRKAPPICVFTFCNGKEVFVLKQAKKVILKLGEFLSEESQHKFVSIGIKDTIIRLKKMYGKSFSINLEDVMKTYFESEEIYDIREAITQFGCDSLYSYPDKSIDKKNWNNNYLTTELVVYTSFKVFWLSKHYEHMNKTKQETQSDSSCSMNQKCQIRFNEKTPFISYLRKRWEIGSFKEIEFFPDDIVRVGLLDAEKDFDNYTEVISESSIITIDFRSNMNIEQTQPLICLYTFCCSSGIFAFRQTSKEPNETMKNFLSSEHGLHFVGKKVKETKRKLKTIFGNDFNINLEDIDDTILNNQKLDLNKMIIKFLGIPFAEMTQYNRNDWHKKMLHAVNVILTGMWSYSVYKVYQKLTQKTIDDDDQIQECIEENTTTKKYNLKYMNKSSEEVSKTEEVEETKKDNLQDQNDNDQNDNDNNDNDNNDNDNNDNDDGLEELNE